MSFTPAQGKVKIIASQSRQMGKIYDLLGMHIDKNDEIFYVYLIDEGETSRMPAYLCRIEYIQFNGLMAYH